MNEYDFLQDEALVEFLSMEDDNSSVLFKDYSPTDEQVNQWVDESLALFDIN